MVNLVEDWKAVERYAKNRKLGFYQTISNIKTNAKTIEIRVSVGEVGFMKKFENEEAPLFKEILDFCKSKEYIEVHDNIPNNHFFK